MISVGVDIGIRQVAVGIPRMGYAAIFSLKIRELDRPGELMGIREFLFHLTKAGGGLLFAQMHLWVEEAYLSNGPHANQTTTIGMAETVGCVLGAEKWGKAEKIGQSSWKKGLLGDGNASKDEIADWLATNRPDLFAKCAASQDMIDAMCIGLYGEGRDSGRIATPAPRPKKKRTISGSRPNLHILDEMT